MTEYSKIARGKYTSTGAAQLISLPFIPDTIELLNYTSFATPAQHDIPLAWWDVGMGQGVAAVEIFNATPVLTTGVVVTGGFSTVAAGQLLQYGPTKFLGASGGIVKATSIVTTTSAHGLTSGNVVIFQNLYQTTTTGMAQICGIPFVVTVLSATTFSINANLNQSNYTAISTGGLNTLASFKQVLYPALYAPGIAFIDAITLGATTAITTTAPHNFQVGQEVAFRITPTWGTYQLNSLPNISIPGSPVYGFVTAVGSSTTMTVNINSSLFTAFNSNQTIASVPGLNWPEVVAVGDMNTGFGANSVAPLYPSPTVYNGYSTTAMATINGPAILGSYINATFQGFIIGQGPTTGDALANLGGDADDVIYWQAAAHDYSAP